MVAIGIPRGLVYVRWQRPPWLSSLGCFRRGGNGSSSTGGISNCPSPRYLRLYPAARTGTGRRNGCRLRSLLLFLYAARHAADGFGKLCCSPSIHLAEIQFARSRSLSLGCGCGCGCGSPMCSDSGAISPTKANYVLARIRKRDACKDSRMLY